jgi:hypothetical protein
MLVSSLTAGLVAPALWDSVGNLAGGMVANLAVGLGCIGLWWVMYRRQAQPT